MPRGIYTRTLTSYSSTVGGPAIRGMILAANSWFLLSISSSSHRLLFPIE